MDRQILLIHSDPAVMEDTLNALEPFLDRIMVSTEPALAAHLCRTNTPDLMLLEFTPKRFGGSEGLHEDRTSNTGPDFYYVDDTGDEGHPGGLYSCRCPAYSFDTYR